LARITGTKQADIEDLFEASEYLKLFNRAFGSALTEADLTGNDPIVSRIARHLGIERLITVDPQIS